MFLYIYDCSHRCISLPNASSSLACQNCSYKPGTLCTNAHMSWDFLTLAEQLKAATQYFLPRASAMSIYRYICMLLYLHDSNFNLLSPLQHLSYDASQRAEDQKPWCSTRQSRASRRKRQSAGALASDGSPALNLNNKDPNAANRFSNL